MSKQIQFRTIRLDGFGCFGPERREFTLRPDALNVVIGQNEAGKTTLVRAIFSLLFGIYNHELRLAARPWDERAPFGGELDIVVEGETYRFIHDFERSLGAIESLDEHGEPRRTLFSGSIGKRSTREEALVYRRATQQLLGLATPAFLLNSTIVRQTQTDVDIGSDVHRIISGMRRGDVNRIRQRLEQHYTSLTDYNQFSKRPLKDRAIERIEKRLTERRECLERNLADAERYDRLTFELNRIDTEIKKSTATLGKAHQRQKEFEQLYQYSEKRRTLLEKLTGLRTESRQRREREDEIRDVTQHYTREYQQWLSAPAELDQQLEELVPLQSQFQTLREQHQRSTNTHHEHQERSAELQRIIALEFAEFRAVPEDFPARIERLAALHEQWREIDGEAERINEKVEALDRQIKDYGILGKLGETFTDQWYRAREILSQKSHLESEFDHFNVLRGRWHRGKNVLSFLILAFAIGLGSGLFYLIMREAETDGAMFSAYAILISLVTLGVGAVVLMRSAKRGDYTLRHQTLIKTIERLEEELADLRHQWGSDSIELSHGGDLDRFNEAQELRRQRQALLAKLREYAPAVADAPAPDADAAPAGVKPRKTQIEEELRSYGAEYREFESQPLDRVLARWNAYAERRDELEKLQTLTAATDPAGAAELARTHARHAELLERVRPFLEQEDVDRTRRRLREFREEVRRAEILSEQLRHERPVEDVENELSAAETEFNQVAAAIDGIVGDYPGLRPLADHPAELSDKITEETEKAAALERQVLELRDQLYNLRDEVAKIHLEDDVDIEQLREQIEGDQREVERLKRECRALEIAIETLEECERDFQMVHMDRIGQLSHQYFGAITGGAYEVTGFDREYQPIVAGKAKSPIGSDALSRGTRDQLDLAVRFALARELAGDAAWPFLLDDPFVNCDEMRLERLREALTELSRSHQIILFTHSLAYADWGEALLL